MKTDRFSIGRVYINITNSEHTKKQIDKAIHTGVNGYICVSNMRTVMIGNKDKQYCEVMRNSYMNIPDGMPLVWCGKLWGCKDAQRSSGPDLFVKMLDETNPKYKHFLLGDTNETLAKVKERFPKANIVGTYSPPFKPLEEYDLKDLGKMIDDSGANIVWTSLRAPKQDILGSKLLPYVHSKLFIGVGAAFRFSLGEYSLPPEWIRKCGLSGFWLLRNTNIWKESKWYIIHLWFLAISVCRIGWGRMIGKMYYE